MTCVSYCPDCRSLWLLYHGIAISVAVTLLKGILFAGPSPRPRLSIG